MKHISLVIYFLLALLSGCNANQEIENKMTRGSIVIHSEWFKKPEEIRYIGGEKEIQKAKDILKVDGGHPGHLMCGNTHYVFEVDSAYGLKIAATANVTCSTLQVRDSFYRGVDQINALLQLSKKGQVRLDTLRDSSELENWIRKKANDTNFIAFNAKRYVLYAITAYVPLYRTTDTGKTMRAFFREYDDTAKNWKASDDFRLCESRKTRANEIALCDTTSRSAIGVLDKLGIRYSSTQIGLIIKIFMK